MVALGAQIAAERGKLAGGDHGDGSGRIVGGKRDTKEDGHDFVSLEKSPLSTPFSLELPRAAAGRRRGYCPARKSVVSGKSVSVRVDLGGRRSIKKQHKLQD